MIKIKKLLNLKIIAILATAIFFTSYVAFAIDLSLRGSSLRVPVGSQDIYDRIMQAADESGNRDMFFIKGSDGKDYGVKKIDIKDIDEYVNKLRDVYRHEANLHRELWDKLESEDLRYLKLSVDEFDSIYVNLGYMVKRNPKILLALFVIVDITDNRIIGARLLYKDRGRDAEIINGHDAVMFYYQGLGLGTRLREITFQWMMENGYYKYEARIKYDNKKSLKSMIKAVKNLGGKIKIGVAADFLIVKLPKINRLSNVFPAHTRNAL
jgi:hypothetical protein